MLKKNIKLVVADIDGTLTGPVIKQLSDLNRNAILDLQRNGVLFGIASGRTVEMQLLDQYKKWNFDKNFDVLIGMNGAEYYDGLNEKHISVATIAKEEIKEIIDLMKPYNLNPCIYKHNYRYCLRIDNDVINSFHKNNIPNKPVEESELYNEDNAKIMFRISEDRIDKIRDEIQPFIHGGFETVKTQKNMLEFVPVGVALEKFCLEHSISMNDVITFGDEENDITMLESAGVGVCMLNGSDITKAHADVVSDLICEDDGFGDYIYKHIL